MEPTPKDSIPIKYLVIGTGRSGSSLLSAILADAGANFGMAKVTEWKRSAGAYEHDEIQKAGKAFNASRKFAEFAHGSWLARKRRRYHAAIAKSAIRRLFDQADYAKSMDLVWLVHMVYKLDYWPKIILVYRGFEDIVPSAFLSFAWTYDESRSHYLNVYGTALAQLQVFGGCVVGYEELLDTKETDWAAALSQVTGLDRARLLSSRDRQISPLQRRETIPAVDSATTELYRTLAGFKGKVIELSGHTYAEKH